MPEGQHVVEAQKLRATFPELCTLKTGKGDGGQNHAPGGIDWSAGERGNHQMCLRTLFVLLAPKQVSYRPCCREYLRVKASHTQQQLCAYHAHPKAGLVRQFVKLDFELGDVQDAGGVPVFQLLQHNYQMNDGGYRVLWGLLLEAIPRRAEPINSS